MVKKILNKWVQEIFAIFLCLVHLVKQTKSEILNLGRHEFAPWQIGITG